MSWDTFVGRALEGILLLVLLGLTMTTLMLCVLLVLLILPYVG